MIIVYKNMLYRNMIYTQLVVKEWRFSPLQQR